MYEICCIGVFDESEVKILTEIITEMKFSVIFRESVNNEVNLKVKLYIYSSSSFYHATSVPSIILFHSDESERQQSIYKLSLVEFLNRPLNRLVMQFHMDKLLKIEAERLELLEAQFNSLVGEVSDIVMLYDYVTDYFPLVNDAAVKTFGYSKEEFKTLAPHNLSPGKQQNDGASLSEASSRVLEAIEHGRAEFDWVHKTKSGVEYPCVVNLTRFPGVNSYFRVIIRGRVSS